MVMYRFARNSQAKLLHDRVERHSGDKSGDDNPGNKEFDQQRIESKGESGPDDDNAD